MLSLTSNLVSMEDITERENKRYANANDIWKRCGQEQLEYFSRFPRFRDKVHPTLMFDEIDKSLDIETVLNLYTVTLPTMTEKWHNQIILVSHNPLVLSNEIYNNPIYNVISVDPEYTEDTRKMLRKITF